MLVDRSIRAMTPQEKHAKREWGTGACQARNCTSRAAYLVMENSSAGPDGEWWEYCCPRHAREFAEQHGLELPVVPTRAPRALAAQ